MIICKICGDAVRSEVACCARCFTPHHFDCWSFAGQCSIYACGGKDHRYFDFRDRPESELLAAIGESLKVALREDAAAPAPAAQVSRSAAAMSSADELLAYRRNMFRSLHAVLAKVAPGSLDGDLDLVGSFDDAVDGPTPARLFLAEDLEVDAGSGKSGMDEKRRLLHRLADSSNLPDREDPPLVRLRAWLRAMFGKPG